MITASILSSMAMVNLTSKGTEENQNSTKTELDDDTEVTAFSDWAQPVAAAAAAAVVEEAPRPRALSDELPTVAPLLLEEEDQPMPLELPRRDSHRRRDSVSLLDISSRGLAALDLSESQSSLFEALRHFEMELEGGDNLVLPKKELEAAQPMEETLLTGLQERLNFFVRNVETIFLMLQPHHHHEQEEKTHEDEKLERDHNKQEEEKKEEHKKEESQPKRPVSASVTPKASMLDWDEI